MSEAPRIVNINISDIVAAVVRVMTEPYKRLVETLRADGRLTDAELEALTVEILRRGDLMGDLIQEELRRQADGGQR